MEVGSITLQVMQTQRCNHHFHPCCPAIREGPIACPRHGRESLVHSREGNPKDPVGMGSCKVVNRPPKPKTPTSSSS